MKGLELKRGALATSFAHDSHNIVSVGVSDGEVHGAVNAVEQQGGVLMAYRERRVVASLPLPVAGIMTTAPLEGVVQGLTELERTAEEMGCTVACQFSVLSFLALPVVPGPKLTNRGLVDVEKGRFVQAGVS